MLKSMKYEFRKNAFVLTIIGVVFVIAEIMFLIGTGFDNEKLFGIGLFVLLLLGFVGSAYIMINGVNAYSRDLKDKSGYLVFMAPISTYKIIGAKLLMIFVEILVFSIVSFLAAVVDIFFFVRVQTDVTMDEILEGLSFFFQMPKSDLYMQIAVIVAFVFSALLALYMIVTLAYLSISLSATVFQNKRGKGLVSFLVFIALGILLSYIGNMIPNLKITYPEDYQLVQIYLTSFANNLPSYAYMLAVCAASYIGTVKLLDKQISL